MSDLSLSDTESESEKIVTINRKPSQKMLNKFKEFEDTDESVIFAENSSDQLTKTSMGKNVNANEKDTNVKKQAQKRKISEHVDESESLKHDTAQNRQFIYIQVIH